MSNRYKGGIISATPPVTTTSKGIWTLTQQMQAKGASVWPTVPDAPTIGTATVASGTSASVTFTAPAYAGYPGTITGYTATSTPGCVSQTGVSSPLVVSGLTTGTAYTFKVKATNATGTGPQSAASNSVTPIAQGQDAYTAVGTFSWVAPAGVTSVSIVAIGGGGGGSTMSPCCGYQGGGGGGGGGLGYKNNQSVTPGCSYSVIVGGGGAGGFGSNTYNPGGSGCFSRFVSQATVQGNGGCGGSTGNSGGAGGSYSGTGGGSGGGGGTRFNGQGGAGGGGAGGYAGNGGSGGSSSANGSAGAGGGGGGGAGTTSNGNGGGAGGGVGLLGQGTSGTGGTASSLPGGGTGGSSGSAGGSGTGTPFPTRGGTGGAYGGGGGGNQGGTHCYRGGPGGAGAVRIIYPGTTRSFPSTCTGNL